VTGEFCVDRGERVRFYETAKAALVARGFQPEIDWQASRVLGTITAVEFMVEAAWVVINSGFREAVARRIFPALTLCFCDWAADEISSSADDCRTSALTIFGHRQKIDAIIHIAGRVTEDWDSLQQSLSIDPIKTLQELPFIGPITSFHLAKNLGYPCAKADRHLARTAELMGQPCVQELCSDIAVATGDPVGVVDLILWRYAADVSPSKQWAN
jgi:hypothetical protein